MSVTDVAGVRVGHWTDATAQTGCTVIVPPSPNVVAVDVRGAAPGSRELALLRSGMSVQEISALVLTGGSAFGLDAATGVMAGCEADMRGFVTPAGIVPIVPAAVIFDLMIGDGSVRPGAEQGRVAYDTATDEPVGSGRFGCGAGATVAKWRGLEAVRLAGIGSASTTVGNATVAALTVVNAFGDVYALGGDPLTGGPGLGQESGRADGHEFTNTTLSCIVTDATVDRLVLERVAVRAHDALGATISPVHTRFDGDTVFAISTLSEGPVDPEALGDAAFRVVAASVAAAVSA